MKTHARVSLTMSMALIGMVALTSCKDRDASATADSAGNAMAGAANTAVGNVENALKIEEVKLGRSVGADNRIADGTSEFKPNETVYAVVETNAKHAGKPIIARFATADGTLIEEQTQNAVASGNDRAIATFKLAKTGGWAVGKYRVSFWHEGKEIESEDFEVKN